LIPAHKREITGHFSRKRQLAQIFHVIIKNVMENSEAVREVLNDLIEINNDRIKGYEKAIKELADGDQDLVDIFLVAIDQSREARNILGKELQALGGEMRTDTTTSGKIYRAWMDVKAVFSGHDRRAVLSNCEFGEDAAQRAYDAALHPDHVPTYLKKIFQEQKVSFRSVHNDIRTLRDQLA
jgi:uncharacterized protein (TIGR02284 family)